MLRHKKRIIAFVLMTAILLTSLYIPGSGKAFAATVKTITCNVNSLNIRKGPGTSYDKVVVNGVSAFMKSGDTATVTAKENGWTGISICRPVNTVARSLESRNAFEPVR